MARPPRPGTHQALLDAARDEFARHGLERARVEDVSRRAGVSKGAFYLHFRSKEEAFEQIVQRFIGALEEQAHRRHEAEERFTAEHAGERAFIQHRQKADVFALHDLQGAEHRRARRDDDRRPAALGEQLAGGRSAKPGAIAAPNLTPGGELSAWNNAQFINTIRTGAAPSGHALNPGEMPWKQFNSYSDEELSAIFLYLQSLPELPTVKP